VELDTVTKNLFDWSQDLREAKEKYEELKKKAEAEANKALAQNKKK
jgi:hypothetical protein